MAPPTIMRFSSLVLLLFAFSVSNASDHGGHDHGGGGHDGHDHGGGETASPPPPSASTPSQFDPATGQPLARTSMKFDPQTGQPLPVAPVVGQSVAPSGGSGKVPRLMELKDLLDGGVLTQEEFDAQKKAILQA